MLLNSFFWGGLYHVRTTKIKKIHMRPQFHKKSHGNPIPPPPSGPLTFLHLDYAKSLYSADLRNYSVNSQNKYSDYLNSRNWWLKKEIIFVESVVTRALGSRAIRWRAEQWGYCRGRGWNGGLLRWGLLCRWDCGPRLHEFHWWIWVFFCRSIANHFMLSNGGLKMGS